MGKLCNKKCFGQPDLVEYLRSLFAATNQFSKHNFAKDAWIVTDLAHKKRSDILDKLKANDSHCVDINDRCAKSKSRDSASDGEDSSRGRRTQEWQN